MSNSPSNSRHRYQKIREIGHNLAGGRITYLATDTATRETVVIKQFQFAQPGANWSGFKTYDRELKILQSLNHPAIPRYLNSFETSKGFCMVQEYKDAPSLAVMRSFALEEIKQIAISVLDVLIYLQSQTPPIIHRDIKPENILVDERLNVYLIDFGFAQISNNQGTTSSTAAGTFGFMAPEQIHNRFLTNATDLYGLGATLICLVTGTKSTEIGKLINEEGGFNFKHLVSQNTLTLVDWLEKMVQPNPKNRYPSAAAAKTALLQPVSVKILPTVKIQTLTVKKKPKNSLIDFFKSLILPKSESEQSQLSNFTEEQITLALTRRGNPNWNELDFQKLMYKLGCAGYGWLEAEGVRQQLLALAQKRLVQKVSIKTDSNSTLNNSRKS